MTSLAASPDQARKEASSAVEDLRKRAVSFVEDERGVVSLHALLQHLRGTGAPDETISRAVVDLIAADELRLTSDRRVVRPV